MLGNYLLPLHAFKLKYLYSFGHLNIDSGRGEFQNPISFSFISLEFVIYFWLGSCLLLRCDPLYC